MTIQWKTFCPTISSGFNSFIGLQRYVLCIALKWKVIVSFYSDFILFNGLRNKKIHFLHYLIVDYDFLHEWKSAVKNCKKYKLRNCIITLINSNGLTTSITILSKHAVKAGQAVGSTLPHDIPLSSQVSVTLKAGKMFHMPGSTLRLCTLIREDYLKLIEYINTINY